MPRKGTGDGLPGCGCAAPRRPHINRRYAQVVGTKVITKRLAVSLLMRVARGQTRCQTSGVPFSRAALSNKDVWRLLLRATLIAAAIALLSFGWAGPKMNAAISDA